MTPLPRAREQDISDILLLAFKQAGLTEADVALKYKAERDESRAREMELARCLVAVLDPVDYRASLDSGTIRRARELIAKVLV